MLDVIEVARNGGDGVVLSRLELGEDGVKCTVDSNVCRSEGVCDREGARGEGSIEVL